MTIEHDAPSGAAQFPARQFDAVTAPPDPIELIRNVLTKAAEFIGAPHGFIAHVTPDEQELTVRLGLGAFDRPVPDGLGSIEGLAVDTWRAGKPRVVRRDAIPTDEERFHELAFVPFDVGPRVGGIVGLAYGADSVLSFRTAEIDLISGFCRLASFALDNARLYAEEKRTRRLTERLQDSVRAINQSLDLDVVLPAILDQLREVIEYDSSTVQLLEGDAMRVIAARGFPPDELGRTRNLSEYPYNKRLATSPEPIVEGHASTAVLWRSGPHLAAVRSNLGIPLVVRDRIIGALTIDSHQPNLYSADDAPAAMAFARHAAIAIEHARLFTAAQRELVERKEAQKRLNYLACFDPVTALPNRTLLNDRLRQALAQAGRDNKIVAILFLDLDRFKTVNDSMGHTAGDRLLKIVGERLRHTVREGDTVARLGGDEFAVVLPQLDNVQAGSAVADKIGRAFRQPFDLDGREIWLSTSIGVAVYPSDGADLDELLNNADSAMYLAKNQGGSTHRLYEPRVVRAVDRLDIENDLRHAVDREELRLLYQPLVEMATGRMLGAEALVRWAHPRRGLVLPEDFIGLAEETGLIVPLGRWVLGEACRQGAAWQQAGAGPHWVTVNVSARQLNDSLVRTVHAALAATGVDPHGLLLEITESDLMQNTERAVAATRELASIGVSFAIDDFGIGYSSLSQLKRFPISLLKIDQSFVRDIPADASDAALVTGIVAMSHAMGLRVVAEGVETEDQRSYLRDCGCDIIQGFLAHPPLSNDDLQGSFLLTIP
ncbi:MAG: EAL domain-containing protein [Actinomycetota bacterium]|nr:EAL domain-containing protein [Actinomycetota bacterium]